MKPFTPTYPITYPPHPIHTKFPPEQWSHIQRDIYTASLTQCLQLPDEMFRPAIAEGRFTAFLTSYIHEAALRPSSRGSGEKGSEEERVLRQKAFLLVHRIYLISIFAWNKLSLELRTGEFLLDLCNAFPKSKTLGALLSKVGAENEVALREAFKDLRINILGELPSTKKTPPKNRLAKENELAHRIHSLAVLFLVSVTAAEEFITGSDFLDSLIEVFENLDKKSKLRSEILRAVHAVHYALLGSGDNDGDGDSNGDGGEGNEKGRADGGRKINYRLLLDEMNQLLLRGPGSKEHNFLEALVNETTYLRMLNKHIPFAPPEAVPKIAALKNSLEKNHQSTTSGRKPKRPIRGKVEKQKGNKGKNKAEVDEETEVQNVMMDEYVRHVKEMFPELQDDWVREMLEQHRGNVDAVVRELLEQREPEEDLPKRRNIYDNDAFDTLSVPLSALHLGRKNKNVTADKLLSDTPNPEAKAAIYSALAAFDSDEDERDDTYDAADVGGAVDSASPPGDSDDVQRRIAGSGTEEDGNEKVLFDIYTRNGEKAFARDVNTRRSKEREQLRKQTGWTDEAIEGWAIMLGRDPRRLRSLENKYSLGAAVAQGQYEIARTAYRKGPEDDESSGGDAGRGRGRGGYRGRGVGGRGRGRGSSGRGGGDAGGTQGGPSQGGDNKADRAWKEHNKSKRANHNRKDANARKMARGGGGFPPP